ncbi:hypothetical protein FA13DRAFT_1717460 [Coprinellus micaceus]|uniref:CxC2-like cysteine cluster KDZ transposase-associated domain-containing protein n=1 Tax=Coprinellus micaceus TaxID=71717 RepID=A0A4Y7SG55_COPMI|nr:hypothetical protein FA13DRAFT_1717460 [Coprinellus micaceus]
MGRRDYSTGNRVTQTHSSATVDARGNLRFQHQTRQARSPEKSQAPAESSAPTTPSHPRSFGEPDGYPVGFDMDSLEFDYGPVDQPQYTLPHRKTKVTAQTCLDVKALNHAYRHKQSTWRSSSKTICSCGSRLFLSGKGPRPFHRVETWNKTHYSPNWLWAAGVCIYLGHDGKPCPNPASTACDELLGTSDKEWADLCRDGFAYNAAPPGNTKTFNEGTMVTVVHTNGVHHLPVVRCGCEGREREMVNDFLKLGLWPASFERVETVFSVDVLKDSLLSFLECHTTASQYFSRLRRCTNYAFPETVTELIEFGFAHNGKKPGDGELAWFCAACPQPDINYKWKEPNDPRHWVGSRSYVCDGCFTLVHQRSSSGNKDVDLKSGEGHMVCSHKFDEYLADSTELPTKNECNQHKALNDRSKITQGCDVTGVGSMACMRHGCFVPGCQVNFQVGERQKNMDYCTSKGWAYGDLSEADYLLFGYDVNCQYHKKHQARQEANLKWIKFPEGLKDCIYYAVGTFHVHEHRAECYPRYATTFIRGLGMLDALMNDNNWKAMVGVGGAPVKYIYSSYTKGLDKHAVAEEEFAKLDKGLDKNPELRKEWEALDDQAAFNRLYDVTVMDIYMAKTKKAPRRVDIEVKLADREQRSKAKEISGEKATLLEIAQRKTAACRKHMELVETAGKLFPEVPFDELSLIETLRTSDNRKGGKRKRVADDDDDSDNSERDGEERGQRRSSSALVKREAYQEPVPLPSRIRELPEVLSAAREFEIELRVGEANDALESIREGIAYKSYTYLENIRPAKSKVKKTRGWTTIKTQDDELKTHVRRYKECRKALVQLGADGAILRRFQVLSEKEGHLRTGQMSEKAAWFWGMDMAEDANGNPYMGELHRVMWLRKRAVRDRWAEELELLTCEMEWTKNYFKNKQREWRAIGREHSGGKSAFGHQQEEMWRHLFKYVGRVFGPLGNELETMHYTDEPDSDSDDDSRQESKIAATTVPERSGEGQNERRSQRVQPLGSTEKCGLAFSHRCAEVPDRVLQVQPSLQLNVDQVEAPLNDGLE